MKLYQVAERVLQKLKRKEGSIKNLIFAQNYKNPKQLYALVCETLKYSEVIQEIILLSKFSIKKCSKELQLLLLYDFLFGKGIRCGGKFKQNIAAYKSRLESALARTKVKRGVVSNEDLISKDKITISPPKYVRVNTLKSTQEDVIKELVERGYSLVHSKSSDLELKEFRIDDLVNCLLMFHSRTDFHDSKLYLEGHIIFQDKASCIPALVLNPELHCDVIDACAAPGNKTSMLAAIMQNTGKIFAFDLDKKRIATMNKLLNIAGVKNCETIHQDFLSVSSNDPQYKNVKYILVDPSCTGSGIVNRMSSMVDSTDEVNPQRVKSLSEFQLKVLNHALSFPNIKKVVYSTCSVHNKENEEVVQKALLQNKDFSLTHCLPEWHRRGNKILEFEKESQCCLRFDPKEDKTNGFFIALISRKPIKNCMHLKKGKKSAKTPQRY